MKARILILAMLAIAIAVGLPSLVSPAEAQAQLPDNGFLRVTHASAGAPAVDVYLNGAPFVAGLEFGKASALQSVAPGTYTVGVRAAGGIAGNEILTAQIVVRRGFSAEAVIMGQRGVAGPQSLRLGYYPINLQPTGGAQVYVIHAASDAPAVDVRAGDTNLISALAYTEGNLTPVAVEAGVYPLAVYPAGGTTPVIDLGEAELRADRIYTVIALGPLAQIKALALQTAAGVGPVTEPGPTGFVRVTHASPGAPAVDIYLNGATTPAITDLSFGASTDLLELPAGSYTVDIRGAGSPATDAPVFSTAFDLEVGQSVEAIATGVLGGDPAFDVKLFPIDRTRLGGKARVYVIHAAPTAPAVELRESGVTLADGLAFGQIAGPLNLDAGVYNPVVLVSGTRDVVAALSQAELEANTVYTVIAYGSPVNFRPLVRTAEGGGGTGEARIIHASPGAPAVDIYLDGATTPAVTGLAFGQTTGYLSLQARTYTVQIRAAGAPFFQTPVFEKQVRVGPGGAADIVALGVLGGEPGFDVRVYPIDRSDSGGNARIYLIHAAPGAGNVDAYFNGQRVGSGVPFGGFSTTPIEVAPGFHNLTVTRARQRSPVITSLAQAELAGDTNYVVIAQGAPNNPMSTQLTPLVLTDARPGTVRVTHASPGAPAVDIYLNDAATPAITNLAFGASSDLIPLAAGSYTVAIRPTGAPATDDPVFSGSVELPAGVTAEILAQGLLEGDPAFSLGVYPINRRDVGDNARVYVIHASPTAPAVEVRESGMVIVPSLAFGEIAGPLDLPAGVYNPVALLPGTRNVVVALSNVELSGGTVYTIIAYGDPVNFRPLVRTAPAQ